jgi:hypothetical protein
MQVSLLYKSTLRNKHFKMPLQLENCEHSLQTSNIIVMNAEEDHHTDGQPIRTWEPTPFQIMATKGL